MTDNNDDRNSFLNEQLTKHSAATIRTTNDLVRSDEGDGVSESSAPRGASAKMTQQSHSQKHKASSRGAFEQAHNKTATTGYLKPLPHLKPLAPKPPSPPKPPTKSIPIKPLGLPPQIKRRF